MKTLYVWTAKAEKIANKANSYRVMRKGTDIQRNDAMVMFYKPYDSDEIQAMLRKGLIELKAE